VVTLRRWHWLPHLLQRLRTQMPQHGSTSTTTSVASTTLRKSTGIKMWQRVLQSGRREVRCLTRRATRFQLREVPPVRIWVLVIKASRLQSLLGTMKPQRKARVAEDTAQLSSGRRARLWVVRKRTLGMETARCMCAATQSRPLTLEARQQE